MKGFQGIGLVAVTNDYPARLYNYYTSFNYTTINVWCWFQEWVYKVKPARKICLHIIKEYKRTHQDT